MSPTSQMLIEQMRINDAEIAYRMELLDFTPDDVRQLLKCKRLIQRHIDSIVDKFYKKLTSDKEMSLIIGDAETLQRLRVAQRQYILDLFEGFYDLEYVNNRLRIGAVHKRIGVEPKYYLSLVQTLKAILCEVIHHNIFKGVDINPIINALDKLLSFDTQLVVDTYIRSLISEIEASKYQVEKYAQSLAEKVAQRTAELRDLSSRDSLTNLFNRRALGEHMRRYIANAKRQGLVLSLIYFDIDNFKVINDTQGHLIGDDVLASVGEILQEISREVDVPCRYGGDEFCVLLPGASSHDAKNYATRLISRFNQLYPKETVSLGISGMGPDAFTTDQELIDQADRAMYTAKKKHGNNCVIYAEPQDNNTESQQQPSST
jgi:diguanylate cyclase